MTSLGELAWVLDDLAPAAAHEAPAWNDVVRRAGRQPGRLSNRRRAVMIATGLAVVLAVVATALAAGRLHQFTSWLTGTPGTSAPEAEQEGFAHRNAASFARFPAGTKLRRLTTVAVAGKRFDLLGFHDGDALCLRAVRTDLPAGRGTTQCATLLELEQATAPGVVVSDLAFRFGKPAWYADGIYGFADDSVRSVDVVRERGPVETVPVVDNAFVSLHAQPAGTVANHPVENTITGVYANERSGGRVRLAYVAAGGVSTASAPPPPPFYIAFQRLSMTNLPGPTTAGRPFGGGTISWVFRREAKGEPFTLPARIRKHFGTVLFSRAIQPDPARPDRMVLMIVRLAPHEFGPRTSTRPVLCYTQLEPISGLSGGIACLGVPTPRSKPAPTFRPGNPISFDGLWPAQIATIGGIAADQVARLRIYLANGRVIPVSVRDNTFLFDLPGSLAAKAVAYDASGHVISVEPLQGSPSHYASCPSYQPSKQPIEQARPWERVDLGTATLNGHKIFGATTAEVIAALGKPARVLHNTVINGVRIPEFLYGGRVQGPGTTAIQFGKHGAAIVAVSIQLQSSRVTDARIGRVLDTDPQIAQAKIEQTYVGYRLLAGYGTLQAHGCQFSLDRGHFGTHIGLTEYLDPRHPSQITLGLRSGY